MSDKGVTVLGCGGRDDEAALEASFRTVATECVGIKEFVANFERLSGHKLHHAGSPLDQMIDNACGRTDEAWTEFFRFVRDYVWLPWLQDMATDKAGIPVREVTP